MEVIEPMIEGGILPNLKKLKEQGVWSELYSIIPPITGPAWTSIAIGKNSGKHGIF